MSAALSLADAAERIRRGGLVAYPTETVWGLGADARSACAVEALRAWKGRDAHKPMSVLVRDYAALVELGVETTPLSDALAARFWPGPLTLVLRCGAAFAPGVAGDDGAVGFRCSSHPVARALARDAGAITATSFNRSGDAPCATRAEAERCADAAVALAAGEDAHGAAPSSVVTVMGGALRVLREGAIPAQALAVAAAGGTRG